ncbi:tRNA threonylcarbamoyladenosine dehydratase [Undibacterium oligocarboniphilum]|uniref:tRNA threonylcarbamoyladenosine dehydratase n=1 Tax=Undibacterium oligocarboniphilum TaxID=666702 RepID=A0A850QMT2_9BURK|nr:tRNA threonylcarbamoyladenosine dehydratase [Undibacterium oligocarboniphilum]MBC3869783.1 tRNA threonylcarbamoyladenosine dehydratase [Undibacterium oligocarboniphilum]NVO77386.1 tRNA threonylcarbamoyladenosine dehydratase [Undibacterium oligocarboniphilum]
MQQDTDIDFDRRFGGIARLYGAQALQRFQDAHVCVIGVGGVGSWVVEALARSAIGQLTMIDLDNVAESNINRQIQATSDTLGKAKITALAERIALINPGCIVHQVEDFIGPENVAQMLGEDRFDYVIDAIDNVKAKTALIAYCREKGIHLITIGAAGGQTDPSKIMIRDLSRTEQEPLLALVRKRLRQNHGFPRGTKTKFGIDAVFSMEVLTMPETAESCAVNTAELASDDGVSQVDVSRNGGVTGLNCAGFGSSVVVTASFGLMAVAQVLRQLAGMKSVGQ